MRRHTSVVNEVAIRLFNTAVQWPAEIYDRKRLTPTTSVSARECIAIGRRVAMKQSVNFDATDSGNPLR